MLLAGPAEVLLGRRIIAPDQQFLPGVEVRQASADDQRRPRTHLARHVHLVHIEEYSACPDNSYSRDNAHWAATAGRDMDLAERLGFGAPALVAFVGAGGKKTAMGRLVAEGGARDRSVGYTTTVHTPPPADVPLIIADEESLEDTLAGAGSPVAFAAERVPNPERADEKIRGFDAAVVDAVFESERFDWLLVKADGARGREFKAPGPEEPVVPDATTHAVPVASVRAVGKPLDAPVVHRPERVAALTGLERGDAVTTEVVGTVLAHEQGGLKGIPDGAGVTPMVNKADTPEDRERARKLLRVALARSERLQRGLVTSFETDHCEVVRE